jgi:hypothetical protein
VTALDAGAGLPLSDVRPLVHRVLEAFWCGPTSDEALAWGGYPYDSDPAGTAIRPLSRPFTATDYARGDRAWLAGSLALSGPRARDRYLSSAPEYELTGAPETDLSSSYLQMRMLDVARAECLPRLVSLSTSDLLGLRPLRPGVRVHHPPARRAGRCVAHPQQAIAQCAGRMTWLEPPVRGQVRVQELHNVDCRAVGDRP